MGGGVQLGADGANEIFERRQLGPSFRRATHVIQNQAGVGVGDFFGEVRIEGEGAGVVDDFDSELEGFFGDVCFIGIDGDGNRQFPFQPLEDRDEAAEFFGLRNARGAGAGGFSANIDDIGAQFFQFDGAGEGAVGVLIGGSVGERIGSDVEDAENQGAVAQDEAAVAEFPFEAFAESH